MISRGELKKAVGDWKRWLERCSQSVLPRASIARLLPGLSLAIIGVRRSGKSSLSVQLAAQQQLIQRTFYFNFEDPLFLAGASAKVIDQLLSLYEEETGKVPELVILDEIQNVEGWERWVRKAIDLEQFKVIITGSSSQLLSSEIATAVAGRVLECTVWPLSFGEYLSFRKVEPQSEGIWMRELNHYLQWGGFPKAVLTDEESDRILLLKQYLSDIVLRDVVARHRINNQQALNQLVSFYFANLSNLHSYTALRKAFGVSIELAATLTTYLSQAFLVFEVHRYHHNLKVQSRDPKKIYIIDNGLRTVSLSSERKDWGSLAENTVYLELRRRGKDVYYFKQTREVDFVITELGRPVEAIQVCYSDLEDAVTRDREILGLQECLQALDLPSGTILTSTYEDTLVIENKTLHFIPLYKWLMS